MRVTCHYSNDPPFIPTDHQIKGLGGTENFACYVAKNLAAKGHEVKFFNRYPFEQMIEVEGIQWGNLKHFNPAEEVDILISFRMREVFQLSPAARLKVLILADTESAGLGDDVREGRINVVMPVGRWQRDKIATEEGIVEHPCWMQASNGVDMREFDRLIVERIPGRCIHTSTPERGLSLLLDVWPEIEDSELLKERGIKPELHLFSSFKGWGMSDDDNESHSKDGYDKVLALQEAGHAIFNHKHVASMDLREWQKSADLFLYPTNFKETYCISLTEAMAAGAIPVVSRHAALSERIMSGHNGYLVGEPGHDATTDENKEAFVSQVVTALWLNKPIKDKMREAAIQTARNHDYSQLVDDWLQRWAERLEIPVSGTV